jgi:hypothetical protein
MKTLNAKRVAAHLSVLLSLSLVACTGGSGGPGPDGEGPSGKFVIGEKLNELICAEDADCPLGYRCANATCEAIDDDRDNDGFTDAVDCDDNAAGAHPGAAELCNGIDDDCDGLIDEGVTNACGGCGDDPVEVCDMIDNDCDGEVDDDCQAGAFDEIEPNDGTTNCQPIGLPPEVGTENRISGAFDPAGDVDSFCFPVRAGTELVFDMDSQSIGSPTDGVLSLFNAETGDALEGGYSDYADGPDPRLTLRFDEDMEVRLDAYHFYADEGGPELLYELGITALAMVTCEDLDGDGLSSCDGDCNDADVLVFPNQTEVCDGYDNNCDGVADEGCPDVSRAEAEPNDDLTQCELLSLPFTVSGVIDPRKDKDVFCFFAPAGADVAFDIDAADTSDSLLNSRVRLLASPDVILDRNDDGVDPETGFDEDDSDSYLEHTFARPGVYGIQVTDESLFAGGSRLTYTLVARALNEVPCTDADGDGVSVCEGDCHDNSPLIHFGAPERCDGLDNNCDGVGDPEHCTGDFDGDGFAGADGDCDDSDPNRFPGAAEICDLLDTNCDGEVDEGVTNRCGGCGFEPAERCGDGIDNDCDGVIDDDCEGDSDGDGYTPDQGDCDDTNFDVKPEAQETCDGIDNNCDGIVDEFVKNSCGLCAPEPVEICDGLDNNCNGLVDDGALNACGVCGPLATEVCDGEDNNCDGEIDEGVKNACGGCGPVPEEVCDFVDNDCDGDVDEGCDDDGDGDGVTLREGDCDDGVGTTFFGAVELCDGVDNNCNGVVDDGCPDPVEIEPNDALTACQLIAWPRTVSGTVFSAADEDSFCIDVTVPGTIIDFDVEARDLGSPLDGVLEVYDAAGVRLLLNNDNVDPDTGLTSDDPYGTVTFETPGRYAFQIRAAGTGATAGAGAFYNVEIRPAGGCLDLDGDGHKLCDLDCDDLNASVHPGAVDVCDGIDNNCSDGADERCVGDCLDDVLEPNDTFPTATPVTGGSTAGLTFCGGDPDFFAAELEAGRSATVQLFFAHGDGDLSLTVLDPSGAVAATTNTGNDNESVTFVPTQTGTHRVQVQGPFVGEAGYELVITQAQ